MYVDSHTHLEAPQFDGDREEVIARALQAGVNRIIVAGSNLSSSRKAVEIAAHHDEVFAAVGFHPHDAAAFDSAAREELLSLTRQAKVVAIGEIGLDFYWDRSPREAQVAAFRSQLTLAQEVHVPVIIHVRDAFDAVAPLLREWIAEQGTRVSQAERGVLHCFSGDMDFARFCLEVGFLISFAGPLTYPNADRLESVARAVPLDKILVETDSPYLAPQRFRGQRNEPAHVVEVGRRLAEIRGLPEEQVAEWTTSNATRLFGGLAMP